MIDRFMDKVMPEPNSGCWFWMGAASNGYGYFHSYKMVRAHRWAFEYFIGDIPDDLELDHTCKNTYCVNPKHLEPVTHAENLKRRDPIIYKKKSHCPQGHEYTPDNTYVYPRGHRECRICRRNKSKEWYNKARTVDR